ncbi:MAG: molybdenum cofactor biosynthesis protein MoaE [Deltaproteobacteria bacterium]|nr:molybdenum cofactor biosynthesis protein MoaE [Deltaproteobacteria bacterium]
MTKEDKKVRIQEEDFSVEIEIKELLATSKLIGGVVTFLGTARDFSEGKNVETIEFEEYKGMALKALKKLQIEMLSRFDIIEARIIHRVTSVKPGEQIVLIVVGAEHRKEAFTACQWCIDTLKETVPIWKKELTPDGESWVTSHP